MFKGRKEYAFFKKNAKKRKGFKLLISPWKSKLKFKTKSRIEIGNVPEAKEIDLTIKTKEDEKNNLF